MVTMAATLLSLSLAVAELDIRSFAAKARVCRTVKAPWCTLSCQNNKAKPKRRFKQEGSNKQRKEARKTRTTITTNKTNTTNTGRRSKKKEQQHHAQEQPGAKQKSGKTNKS